MVISIQIQTVFKKNQENFQEKEFLLLCVLDDCFCFIFHATISDLVTSLWHTEVGIAQVTAGKHFFHPHGDVVVVVLTVTSQRSWVNG